MRGYRARVLAEILQEQVRLEEFFLSNPEVLHCPALLLHGSGDKLYSVRGTQKVHSLWCGAAQESGMYHRLKIYDGAYHQLLNEPNKDEAKRRCTPFGDQ
ncbi:unnamed protein product [Effrenium voratum]|nr:unnamed protein product [Effrenium voratum]